MKIQPIKGTHDIYGKNLLSYKFIEETISNLATVYDYKEIITPIFESTDLFKKPLGEQSDVVLKEMYTFNDKNESSAIAELFKNHSSQLKVSSTKSMTGHLLGAAGGIEAVASVKTILEQTLQPTINYETPDPDCTLDYVPNTAQTHTVNAVLSNTFGFGGHNAVICIRKYC